MNKRKFISLLSKRIKKCSKEEIRNSIEYYEEIIADRIEDGMSEEEAVDSLGSLDEIVELIEQRNEMPDNKVNSWRYIVISIVIICIAIVLIIIFVNYGRNNDKSSSDIKVSNNNNNTISSEKDLDTIIEIKEEFDSKTVDKIVVDLRTVELHIVKSEDEMFYISYRDKQSDCFFDVENIEGVLSIVSKTDLSQSNTNLRNDENIIFEIAIPNSFAGEYEISLVSGNMFLCDIDACSPVAISEVSGNVMVTDCSFAEASSISTVSGNADLQSIDLRNDLTMSIVSGNITMTLKGKSDSYRINTDVQSGEANVPHGNENGIFEMKLEATSGNINIDFLEDN